MSEDVIPESLKQLSPGRLNVEQAFLTFCAFAGNVDQTAFALNVRPQDIEDAAGKFGWRKKLSAILELRKSASPGDTERAINRALSFVQAHRARLFIDRVLCKLEAFSDETLEEYVFPSEITKTGDVVKKVSTRWAADLASSIEKLAAVCSQALADTSADRKAREESAGGADASGALHASIAAAMASFGAEKSPAGLLLEAQMAVGSAQAAKVKVQ